MYLNKQENRPGTDRQSIDVLISVLEERDSALAHHLADVADLAEAVGRRLQVPEPQLAAIRQAAELHDVGKLAIPEEILGKPGPLAEDEWGFVRRHTVIGERILGSAPVLGRGREDRPLDPRALGRNGLPRPARRNRDPARSPDHLRLRRLRRHDLAPAIRDGADTRGRVSGSSSAAPGPSSTTGVVEAFAAVQSD